MRSIFVAFICGFLFFGCSEKPSGKIILKTNLFGGDIYINGEKKARTALNEGNIGIPSVGDIESDTPLGMIILLSALAEKMPEPEPVEIMVVHGDQLIEVKAEDGDYEFYGKEETFVGKDTVVTIEVTAQAKPTKAKIAKDKAEEERKQKELIEAKNKIKKELSSYLSFSEGIIDTFTKIENDRFFVSSKDFIFDKKTGLLWQKSFGDRKKDYCSKAELDGVGEWRLPTIRELLSLRVPEEEGKPKYFSVSMMQDAFSMNFSPFLATSPNKKYFYEYSFKPKEYPKKVNFNYNIRCVKGKEFELSKPLEKKQNIIFDPNTNLYWENQQNISKNKKAYINAKKYCENLTLGEDKKWRLPSFNELMSAVDFDVIKRYKNSLGAYNYFFKKIFYQPKNKNMNFLNPENIIKKEDRDLDTTKYVRCVSS